jgi:hypothetical protein
VHARAHHTTPHHTTNERTHSPRHARKDLINRLTVEQIDPVEHLQLLLDAHHGGRNLQARHTGKGELFERGWFMEVSKRCRARCRMECVRATAWRRWVESAVEYKPPTSTLVMYTCHAASPQLAMSCPRAGSTGPRLFTSSHTQCHTASPDACSHRLAKSRSDRGAAALAQATTADHATGHQLATAGHTTKGKGVVHCIQSAL